MLENIFLVLESSPAQRTFILYFSHPYPYGCWHACSCGADTDFFHLPADIFPTGLQTAFPQPRNSGSLHTFPQRLLRLPTPIRSYPNENMKKAGVQPIGQTERLYAHFLCMTGSVQNLAFPSVCQ